MAALIATAVEFSEARAVGEGTPTPFPLIPSVSPPSTVTPSDFILLKVIGRGAYGKVLQVAHATTGRVYAMKVYSKSFLAGKDQLEYTLSEKCIMARLRHPYIVALRFAFQTRTRLFLLSDYCGGGELFRMFRKKGLLMEDAAKVYLGEIILALEHMHKEGVVHRDIKPENILLDSEGHIAITDFGLSKDFKGSELQRTRSLVGTDEYLAPEMILHSKWWARQQQQQQQQQGEKNKAAAESSSAPSSVLGGLEATAADPTPSTSSTSSPPPPPIAPGYGFSVDFWALGALAYEMLAGEAPFVDRSRKELYRRILNERLHLPSHLSASALSLLKELLVRDPDKRLGCSIPPPERVPGDEAGEGEGEGAAGGGGGGGGGKGGKKQKGSQKGPPRPTLYGIESLKGHPFFAGLDWGKLALRQVPPPFALELNGATDYRYFDPDFIDEPMTLDLDSGKPGGAGGGGGGKKKKPAPAALPAAPSAAAAVSEGGGGGGGSRGNSGAKGRGVERGSEASEEGKPKTGGGGGGGATVPTDYGSSPILAGLKFNGGGKGGGDGGASFPPLLELESGEVEAVKPTLTLSPSSPHDDIKDFAWICPETELQVAHALEVGKGGGQEVGGGVGGVIEGAEAAAAASSAPSPPHPTLTSTTPSTAYLSLTPEELEAIKITGKHTAALPSTPKTGGGFMSGGGKEGGEGAGGDFIVGVVAQKSGTGKPPLPTTTSTLNSGGGGGNTGKGGGKGGGGGPQGGGGKGGGAKQQQQQSQTALPISSVTSPPPSSASLPLQQQQQQQPSTSSVPPPIPSIAISTMTPPTVASPRKPGEFTVPEVEALLSSDRELVGGWGDANDEEEEAQRSLELLQALERQRKERVEEERRQAVEVEERQRQAFEYQQKLLFQQHILYQAQQWQEQLMQQQKLAQEEQEKRLAQQQLLQQQQQPPKQQQPQYKGQHPNSKVYRDRTPQAPPPAQPTVSKPGSWAAIAAAKKTGVESSSSSATPSSATPSLTISLGGGVGGGGGGGGAGLETPTSIPVSPPRSPIKLNASAEEWKPSWGV